MTTAKKTEQKSQREKVIIKIIVLGSANVGKTSLMQRYATGKFSEVRRATVGSDFMTKRMQIHDFDVALQIWDTAGQERFHQGTIGSSFYRGAQGALLVYDVSNEKSFEQLALWRDECMSRQEQNKFFPIVIVGNKTDIRDATPPEERIDQTPILNWCSENQYGHMETSAKDDVGVEASMIAVTALALETHRLNPTASKLKQTKDSRINLENRYDRKRNNPCDNCVT